MREAQSRPSACGKQTRCELISSFDVGAIHFQVLLVAGSTCDKGRFPPIAGGFGNHDQMSNLILKGNTNNLLLIVLHFIACSQGRSDDTVQIRSLCPRQTEQATRKGHESESSSPLHPVIVVDGI
jgi:hypothetical protein